MIIADKPWNLAETPEELVSLLDGAVSAIEQSQAEKDRVTSLVRDLELYKGVPLAQMGLADLSTYGDLTDRQNLKYNVVYSVVSTIVSRICSFRPRGQFIPDAGNYKTHRVTRNLNAASDAWAVSQEYQVEAAKAFRDCLTGPGGVLKIYIEDGKVKMGRFPAWEIKVSEEDGKYGDHECMYHVRYIPLQQALGQYGDTEAARSAIGAGAVRLSQVEGFSAITSRNGKPLVRVVDAYKKAPEGRHTILCGDHIVSDDKEWRHESHPFPMFLFDWEQLGTWGNSAISQIRTVQAQLDEHLATLAEAHHLAAKLIISYPEGSTAPEKLTNETVQLFPYGAKGDIRFHNPTAVEASAYHWFEILKGMAFEILGVSVNTAQATKAPGITAAVAIEAVTDLQSDRLSQLSHAWEGMAPKVCDWWYSLSVDLGAGAGEYLAVDRGQTRTIKFEAGHRKPTIRAFPTSLFGISIPARLQKAMDAVKAGWFGKEDILRILDVPDLGGIIDLELAEFYYIERLIDGILEDNAYETPDDYASPIKTADYARKRYLLAVADGSYPKENVMSMRKLLDYLQPIAQQAKDKAEGRVPASLVPLPTAPAAPALPGLAQTPEAPLAAVA